MGRVDPVGVWDYLMWVVADWYYLGFGAFQERLELLPPLIDTNYCIAEYNQESTKL